MAENINLIPANELPEAEGNEVRVLCVENGELKQKAASGLGGGSNYDAIIDLGADTVDTHGMAFREEYHENAVMVSGDYASIAAKLSKKESVKILLYGVVENYHILYDIVVEACCTSIDPDGVISILGMFPTDWYMGSGLLRLDSSGKFTYSRINWV